MNEEKFKLTLSITLEVSDSGSMAYLLDIQRQLEKIYDDHAETVYDIKLELLKRNPTDGRYV